MNRNSKTTTATAITAVDAYVKINWLTAQLKNRDLEQDKS